MTKHTDEELIAIAKAATPGPWYQSGSPWFQTGGFVLAGSPDPHAGMVLADLTDTWETQRGDDGLDADHERDPDDDAKFIATFNPAFVLSLIERARTAEEALSSRKAHLESHAAGLVFGSAARHFASGRAQGIEDAIALLRALTDNKGSNPSPSVHVAQSVEPAAHNSLVAGSSPAVDTIPPAAPSLPADVVAALKTADDALCEYACMDAENPTVPCLRSAGECAHECGKPAFEALRKVRAALTPFADRVAGEEEQADA